MPEKNAKDAKISELNIGDAAAGTTLDGNMRLLSNSPYPLFAFRNGTVTKAQLIGFTETGQVIQDITNTFTFRNIENSGDVFTISINGDLQIPNAATPPAAPITNTIRLWSEFGEAKIMDASGNTTTISPHNFEGVTLDPDDPFPVTIHHQNPYLGTEKWIYFSKMARIVEQLSGEQLIFSQDIPTRDWAADEIAEEQRRAAAIAAYDENLVKIEKLPTDEQAQRLELLGERPQPYTKRNEPDWIKDRKSKGRT